MLEIADRVRIADRRDQQALGVGRGGRRHHLQPRRLQEPGLGVLGVERSAGEAAAGRQADDDRRRDALAVVELGGDVDELVEPAGDEVGELHLADRPQPLDRGADGGSDDRVLGERHVEHPLGAELLDEPVGDLERPAEGADVLAQAEHRLVAAHLLAQPVADCFQVRELAHRALAARRSPLGCGALMRRSSSLCAADQCDHGACPSPSAVTSSANTPLVATPGRASASRAPCARTRRRSP